MIITQNLFTTNINIKRRVITVDSTGDFTENFSEQVASGIPAFVQPRGISEMTNKMGIQFIGTHVCYTNTLSYIEKPKNNDRLTDNITSEVFEIVSFMAYNPPNEIGTMIAPFYTFDLKLLTEKSS